MSAPYLRGLTTAQADAATRDGPVLVRGDADDERLRSHATVLEGALDVLN